MPGLTPNIAPSPTQASPVRFGIQRKASTATDSANADSVAAGPSAAPTPQSSAGSMSSAPSPAAWGTPPANTPGTGGTGSSSTAAAAPTYNAVGNNTADNTGNLPTTGRMASATLQAGQQATQDRGQFESLLSGGQSALNNYAQAAMSSAMPNLDAQLQQVEESAQRRGVSNGGLATSYQGDVFGAFQKNLANAVAGQSMNLYGTQLGATQGQLNTDTSNFGSGLTAAQNLVEARNARRRAAQGSLYGGLLNAVGSAVPGPIGGAITSAAGGIAGGVGA